MTAQPTIAWKPDSCACGTRHPCFSLTGPQGPWRCHKCHEAEIAEAVKPAPVPRAQPEGLLL